MGRTSSAVKNRYNAKAYDNLNLRIPKGRRAEIQRAAEVAGESLARYVMAAVEARMAQELPPEPPEDAVK